MARTALSAPPITSAPSWSVTSRVGSWSRDTPDRSTAPFGAKPVKPTRNRSIAFQQKDPEGNALRACQGEDQDQGAGGQDGRNRLLRARGAARGRDGRAAPRSVQPLDGRDRHPRGGLRP